MPPDNEHQGDLLFTKSRSEDVGEVNHSVHSDLPDDDFESDDSVFEFERNLRELMSGLQ